LTWIKERECVLRWDYEAPSFANKARSFLQHERITKATKLVAFFFPVADYRSIFAFTNSANRTVINSIIASTSQLSGGQLFCHTQKPRHRRRNLPAGASALFILAAHALALLLAQSLRRKNFKQHPKHPNADDKPD
jgi:hypothetical protein